MTMKIWGRASSICTQRVLWACTEAGVVYELTLASATMGDAGHVSMGSSPFGVVGEPWYRAMNPNGTIPTIDDDGFVLWESNAIVAYVASRYGREPLYGDCLHTFARALQWMSWTNEHLEPHLHTLVMQFSRLPPEQRDPGAGKAIARGIGPALELLDRHLAASPFMAGEHFSMGDIPAGAAAHRWQAFGLDGPVIPNVYAWLDRLSSREGFRRHVAPAACQV